MSDDVVEVILPAGGFHISERPSATIPPVDLEQIHESIAKAMATERPGPNDREALVVGNETLAQKIRDYLDSDLMGAAFDVVVSPYIPQDRAYILPSPNQREAYLKQFMREGISIRLT